MNVYVAGSSAELDRVADFDPGYCRWHLKLPEHKRVAVGKHVYYVLVRDRLARFLGLVDRRRE